MGCYCGKELKYDSKGILVDGGQPDSWTICRDIRIDNVQVSGHKLQITGKRVYPFHDSERHAFRDINEIHNHETAKYKDLIKTQPVRIEVELSSQLDQSSADAALNEIFWPSNFKFSQAAPDIWKNLFPGEATSSSPKTCVGPFPSTSEVEGAKKIAIVTDEGPGPDYAKSHGGITPPRLIHSPDPEFSDWARKARYQGVTVLKVVVGVDGGVHNIEIVRALGMGLDERAVEGVKQWKFEPARKSDGTVVDLPVHIEVNFRLY